MPTGSSSFKNVSDFSKKQGGEVEVDSALRKVVTIGAVSSGVTFPMSGTITIGAVSISGTPTVTISGTPTIQGTVSISGTPTVTMSGTPDVDIVGSVTVTGTVGISGTPSFTVSGTAKVSVQGTANVDVKGAVTVTYTTPVSVKHRLDASYATKTLSVTAAGTASVVAAQGASTSTRILGFSICNEGATARRFAMMFGTTPFWLGSLMGGGVPMNWNYVNHSVKSAVNKKVVVYANGAATATVTVNWEKA
jgi:hypothetical protein